MGVVLKDTENAWQQVFERSGERYQDPTLVLFDGRVASACGMASAAVGPFYCPARRKVYLDMAFFRELRSASARPAISRRPTWWRTRWATTCRTCSASPTR